MDPNQDPKQATHSPLMASSLTTVSGTPPPYFRLNSLPSIPAFLTSLFFPLHINFSSSLIPFPLSKPYKTLIHLTLLCSAYTSFFTLYPPPHLHSPFSGSQDTLISLSMTRLTLLQNSLSSPLRSLIPSFPLPMILKLIIAHSSTHHGTTYGTHNPSTNFVQSRKLLLHGPPQTAHLDNIPITNRPHSSHSLLSPTWSLFSTLMPVLPYRGNNCFSLLFMPIPPKSQKILFSPVSSLLGSLQKLWNHHKYAKLPPFHLLLQIHLISIFLPSW